MMQVQLLKAKLHRAMLTAADLNYEGSLSIDQDYMDMAGILPYEKILVCNQSNGSRIETYAIPAERGSGMFCLNGAAARHGMPGDLVTIMVFALYSEEEAVRHVPRVVLFSEQNKVVKMKG